MNRDSAFGRVVAADPVPDPGHLVDEAIDFDTLFAAITAPDRAGEPATPSAMMVPIPSRRRQGRALVAVAAAFVAVIAVGVISWLARTQPANDPADQPTTTITTTTNATTPTAPLVTGAASQWEQLDSGLDLGQGRGGVFKFGEGWVAWGRESGIAVSSDGGTWTQVVEVDGLSGFLDDVAVGGPGVVAVDDQGALFSVDAKTWNRLGGWQQADGFWPRDVAFFDGAFLAIGNTQPDADEMVLYRSPDGVTWTIVHSVADSAGSALVATDSFVVAISHYPLTRLWGSDDGVEWRDVTPSGLGWLDCMGEGATLGDLAVLVSCEGLTLVTNDMVTWQAGQFADGLRGRLPGTWSVVAAGPGLVAVFGSQAADFEQTLEVVTSPDGVTWTAVDSLAPSPIPPVEVYDWLCGTTESVGSVCNDLADDIADPSSWHLEWGSIRPAGDAFFLLGRYRLDNCGHTSIPSIWFSRDAMSWEPIELDFSQIPAPSPCANHEAYPFAGVAADGDSFLFVGTGAWRWTPPE